MASFWAPLRPFAPLFWAAGTLLLLELGLEVRASSRGYRAVLLKRGPGVAMPVGTTSFPFRSREPEPRDRAPLWLASSSYGEDVSLPVEDLFATLLAERLGRPVINASHGGYTLRSNLEELEREGPRFHPRLVLLYQMSNDIDQLSERLAAGLPASQAPGAPASASESFAPVSPWVQQLTTYRQLKSQVSSRLAEHLPLWDDLSDPSAIDAFREHVAAFVDGVEALGATPVLITFATAYTPSDANAIPRSVARQNLAMNIVLSPLGWTRSVERFNVVLVNIARERGLVCIDLAAELHGHPELFRDLWHFTPAGHARVAELLAAGLLRSFPELAP